MFISAIAVLVGGSMPATDQLGRMMITNAVCFVLSIVSIIMTCLINTKTKLSGVVLIIMSVAIFFTDFLQIIPLVLLMISGIMCLVRKPEL